MLDYAALTALSEIIRRGSFDAAAAALGVTPSAISQRIKGLEERLGQVLQQTLKNVQVRHRDLS